MIYEAGARIPFNEYLELPCISSHGLMLIERSPFHYKASIDAPRPPSAKQELGTLTHLAILEPDEYARRVSIAPDIDRRSKAGKQEYESYLASLPKDAITASIEQEIAIKKMRDSVMTQPYAAALLANGVAETTVIATISSIVVKGRPDWLPHDLPIIVDLKTAVDASPRGFSRAAANFNYHLQAALYVDLLTEVTGQEHEFVFLVVENEPPYCVALYQLTFDAIEKGRRRYKNALRIYKQCLETGEWPGYAIEVTEIELPRWAA